MIKASTKTKAALLCLILSWDALAQTQCGPNRCLNGGECVVNVHNGFTKHYCDCTTARTSNASFAGRFCEYVSSTFCSNSQDHNGQLFCVNGGTCKQGESHEGCDCPVGFTGPACEFEIEMDATASDYANCTLTCGNGGQCRKGAKDLGILAQLREKDLHLNKTYDPNFEHCVCPEGWVGLQCEHQLRICDGGDQICLHGSQCTQQSDAVGCNCSETTTNFSSAFAGSSCEHPATDICTIGNPSPGTPLSFCVNQGTCKQRVTVDEEHPGCNCVDGWGGPHCEMRALSPSRTRSNDDSGGQATDIFELSTLLICLLSLIIVIPIGVGIYVWNERRKDSCFGTRRSTSRRRAPEDVASKRNLAAGESKLYLGGPIDDDGLDLYELAF